MWDGANFGFFFFWLLSLQAYETAADGGDGVLVSTLLGIFNAVQLQVTSEDVEEMAMAVLGVDVEGGKDTEEALGQAKLDWAQVVRLFRLLSASQVQQVCTSVKRSRTQAQLI